MPSKMKQKGFFVTNDEELKIKNDMTRLGFTNFSAYIRHRLDLDQKKIGAPVGNLNAKGQTHTSKKRG